MSYFFLVSDPCFCDGDLTISFQLCTVGHNLFPWVITVMILSLNFSFLETVERKECVLDRPDPRPTIDVIRSMSLFIFGIPINI